jgi:flagellum-specific ATP synthase
MSKGASALTIADSAPELARKDRADALARLTHLIGNYGGALPLLRHGGVVNEVTSSHIKVSGLESRVELGSCVEVEAGGEVWIGEVIAIQPKCATIKLFTASPRLSLGTRAWVRDDLVIRPDQGWLGRVVDALGRPIDNAGPLRQGSAPYPIDHEPIAPMALDRIRKPVVTGVRVIDIFTPICAGQRIGIFAGAGVGKSTLLSMLTRAASFKTIVVALVAERAREVREFLEDVIAPHKARSVAVVATSSESPMMRKLAAKTATTIAEYFRDQGDDVLLVVDSLTRFAHAQREVALAAGEPPVARGYAPSVFAELPRLLERAGPGRPQSGSITGLFSVLVDGDDHNEPVADSIRGILDGHIVLDRAIADQGRYPAVNPLSSISRLAPLAWSKEEAELVRRLRALVSRYEETRDLRAVGAYKPGANPELDQAVAIAPLLYRTLEQHPDDAPAANAFGELAAQLSELRSEPKPAPAKPTRAGR